MTNNIQKHTDFKKGDYIEGIEKIYAPGESRPTLKIMRGWLDSINKDFNKVYIRADDCYNGARGTSLQLDTVHKLKNRVELWWAIKPDIIYFGLLEKKDRFIYTLHIIYYADNLIKTFHIDGNKSMVLDYLKEFKINLLNATVHSSRIYIRENCNHIKYIEKIVKNIRRTYDFRKGGNLNVYNKEIILVLKCVLNTLKFNGKIKYGYYKDIKHSYIEIALDNKMIYVDILADDLDNHKYKGVIVSENKPSELTTL